MHGFNGNFQGACFLIPYEKTIERAVHASPCPCVRVAAHDVGRGGDKHQKIAAKGRRQVTPNGHEATKQGYYGALGPPAFTGELN